MSVSLQKGQKVSLTKDAPDLTEINVGLGWDVNRRGSGQFDLDAAAISLRNGRFVSDDDLCYFRHRNKKTSAIYHNGDNLTGVGDGDDEVISVKLDKVDPDVDAIIFVVNIYSAKTRKQNFGMVENAFIRLVNARTKQELYRYDLSAGSVDDAVALTFARVYRHNGEWKFAAIGEGLKVCEIGQIASAYR